MKLKIDFVVNEYFLRVVFFSLKTDNIISHKYRMNFKEITVKPLEVIINSAYAVECGNSLIQSIEVQRRL